MTTPRDRILSLLHRFESRNVTFVAADGSWPIAWVRARGVHVWDSEGKRYVDLTAAFGVAAAGHANPRVIAAGRLQMTRLLHAMGDVHPHPLKARLARELSRITFERWTAPAGARGREREKRCCGARMTGKTLFCNSGFEAVEAALKTALLATERPGVIAFHGGYHGLGYGALNTTHREFFRGPFTPQLAQFGRFIPFPERQDQLVKTDAAIRKSFKRNRIGAVLVEPVQGRGGIRVPPIAFLPLLRRLCDTHEALLIVDEVYTGFGRTGKWFACEHSRTVPDLICLGKALTGGFPLSACVGRADVMDAAWPASTGEAIHTSTFLGHPVGCAMVLAQIQELRSRQLVERSARLGRELLSTLQSLHSPEVEVQARGLGLMAGLEVSLPTGAPASAVVMRVVKEALACGYILLPEGGSGNVISLTPPLTIPRRKLMEGVAVCGRLLNAR